MTTTTAPMSPDYVTVSVLPRSHPEWHVFVVTVEPLASWRFDNRRWWVRTSTHALDIDGTWSPLPNEASERWEHDHSWATRDEAVAAAEAHAGSAPNSGSGGWRTASDVHAQHTA